jgi:hypothetical protein
MGQGAAGITGGAGAIGGLGGLLGKANPYLAIASIGLDVGMNLAEASKQKELARAADRDAEKAAAERERLISQDFYDAIQVPQQAYDKEYMANLAASDQAMSAVLEAGQRGVIGAANKVYDTTVDKNALSRAGMEERLFQLDKLQADSKDKIAGELSVLENEKLTGARQAAVDAKAAELNSNQKALQAGGGLIKQAGSMIPDYFKSGLSASGATSGAMTGTGSSVFNKFLPSQSSAFSLPSAPMAPVGFGQSMFQNNPFASVSMPQNIGFESQFNF